MRRLDGGQAPTARRPRKLEHPRRKQVAEGENGHVVVEWARRRVSHRTSQVTGMGPAGNVWSVM